MFKEFLNAIQWTAETWFFRPVEPLWNTCLQQTLPRYAIELTAQMRFNKTLELAINI